MSKKLNLGCGEFHKQGYVNVDYQAVSPPDIRHDLNIVPYPFEDDTFSVIEADHVLEHLDDPFSVMRELHRIGRDGCSIVIRVPHFSRGFTHAQHKRGFDVSFPYYFKPAFCGGFQGVTLDLEGMSLRWFAQPYLKKSVMPNWIFSIAAAVGSGIDFFANLHPFLCSRLWCFWVGGFEEIEMKFIVRKPCVK